MSSIVFGLSKHFVNIFFCVSCAQGEAMGWQKEDSIAYHGHVIFKDLSLVCP
jgi:hypothetical protein